jgi:hypothetical protein
MLLPYQYSHSQTFRSSQIRRAVAVGVGLLAALVHLWMSDPRYPGSDFTPAWYGARAFLQGRSPYDLLGPGMEFDWLWSLNYPATAFLVASPFSVLPQLPAAIVFVGISGALFTYALTKDGWHRIPALFSLPFFLAVVAAQWSPLLASALVLPWVAFVLAVKPTIGLAIGLSGDRRVQRNAIIGGLLLLAVSLAIQPGWISEWLAVVSNAKQIEPPLLRFGGIAILVVLVRWRMWEARLLILMALVPQTGSWYELVPLFLIPRTLNESMTLSMTTGVGWLLGALLVSEDFDNRIGSLMVATGYLPCAIMLLRQQDLSSTGFTGTTISQFFSPYPSGV